MSAEPARVAAIVPAAGVGRRMGSETPKQYLPLAGTTVIEQTLHALRACPRVDRILVGIAENDIHWPQLSCAGDSRITCVEGAQTRAETVVNCLRVLVADGKDNVWVLVHDAVRPCVEPEAIDKLLKTVIEGIGEGGLLATPIVDTLKRADKQGRAAATVAREQLWAAQTPQLFRSHPLLQALQDALVNGESVTDEAAAMERTGVKPQLVESGAENLKITRPQDLALAEYYLHLRQGR